MSTSTMFRPPASAALRRRARSAALVLLFPLLLTAGPIQAADEALTLAEAQRLAVERSQDLAAAEASATAAADLAVAAAELPDPVLRFGLDGWPVTGRQRFSFEDDDFTMGTVAVSQQWVRADKRALRAQRYQRREDLTRAEQAAITAGIERDTARAWFNRHYAEAIAAAVDAQYRVAQQDVLAREAAYRAGRGSQSDVLAARGALLDYQDARSAAALGVANAATALARWIGDDIAPTLAAAPATDRVPLALAALEAQLAHHPQLAVLERREDLAWTETALAEADRRADWNVELAYGVRGAYGDLVSVTLSVPLQIAQARRQDRALAARSALAGGIAAEREEALRAHAAELRALLAGWRSGRARSALWRRERLPLAARQTAAALAAYAAGQTDLAAVLDARRAEVSAELRLLELERDTALAWADLSFQFPREGQAAAHVAASPALPGEPR